MTPSEAFMATQTEVLCQILQTQQQIAQQMNRGPPHGANHEGPNQVTTYAQFIGMKPPTFSKAEDPLEAEAWIKAIEAKFSAFVMPCSKENKANLAALQLRGEALMLLTVNSCIKVRLDLQADKSPVVVKGPFFPRVVNPRYCKESNAC
jgi:hypothetical protein